MQKSNVGPIAVLIAVVMTFTMLPVGVDEAEAGGPIPRVILYPMCLQVADERFDGWERGMTCRAIGDPPYMVCVFTREGEAGCVELEDLE